MDELIKQYAELLRNARIGDYTYEGILAEFARETLRIERQERAAIARKLFPDVVPGKYGITLSKKG